YPLIPEDFDRMTLPEALRTDKTRLYGLTIAPERLHEIRRERRPGSRYADLDNCRFEIREAESLMRREGIRCINSTSKSIEEIATTILRELQIQRQEYQAGARLPSTPGAGSSAHAGIGRAHDGTPVTSAARTPSSASNKQRR